MKQNKFLTGFLIVTLLGAGGLAFLLFQAKGKYTEAMDAYSSKANDLKSLQSGKPFPDQANYNKMLELQKEHQAIINKLQGQLVTAEIPIKPLRPNEFQDKLKKTLDGLRAAAAQQNVALPKDKAFTLDFDKYLTEPPKEEAAAPLGRMLEAIEKAVQELIKTAPTEIRAVKRMPLVEEGLPSGQRQPAATPAPKGSTRPGEKAPEAPLVQRFPFEIEFVAHEPKVRSFINAMVANKEQFYIPAAISVLNEQQGGASKSAATTEAPVVPPDQSLDPNAPPPDPNAPPTPAPASAPAIKFIVGEERLQVLARFEYVDFAEPPAEKTADNKPAPSRQAPK